MRFIILLLLGLVSSTRLTKNNNINILPCRNCVHYKPNIYSSDFNSFMGQCDKFYKEVNVTNRIQLDYADLCRKNEDKCGVLGKYFEQEKNLNFKILKHNIIYNFPKNLLILWIIFGMNNIFLLFCN